MGIGVLEPTLTQTTPHTTNYTNQNTQLTPHQTQIKLQSQKIIQQATEDSLARIKDDAKKEEWRRPCGVNSLRGYRADGTRYTGRVYCGSWTCPSCAYHKQKKYFKRYNGERPIDRITSLYFHGTVEELGAAFNLFALKVKRATGGFERASYNKPVDDGFEITLATRGRIAGKVLRRMWEDVGGVMVSSHEVDRKGFAKFFNAMQVIPWQDLPSRFRVIRSSRGFFEALEKLTTGIKWFFSRSSVEQWHKIDKVAGFKIDGNLDWVRATPPKLLDEGCARCKNRFSPISCLQLCGVVAA